MFESTVIESINTLMDSVKELKSDVRQLKMGQLKRGRESSNTCHPNSCLLYVRVGADIGGKSELESLLGCEVLYYLRLVKNGPPSYKVKIKDCDLSSAVAKGTSEGCFVDKWQNKDQNKYRNSRASVTLQHKSAPESQKRSSFKMTCWNCRGISTSLPYLDALIHEGSKILVLSEHWLWPYDLHRLNDINPEFDAIGKADSRLTEERDGGRGCGGIGMIWHKSITAIHQYLGSTPTEFVESDSRWMMVMEC